MLLVAVGGKPRPLGARRNLPGRASRQAVDETEVSSTVDETRGGFPPHATPGRTYSPVPGYSVQQHGYRGHRSLSDNIMTTQVRRRVRARERLKRRGPPCGDSIEDSVETHEHDQFRLSFRIPVGSAYSIAEFL